MKKTKIDWCDMTWNPITGCFHDCPYCYAARNAYPMAFAPTFHRYRLAEPQNEKKPQNIFVCSMADMFGDWVPDEWIQAIFNACAAAHWHTYLFLTKNPKRYEQINSEDDDPAPLEIYNTSVLFGATVTNDDEMWQAYESDADWISIEPLREEINTDEYFMEYRRPDSVEIPRWAWVVIGAETGNRKDRVKPKREWIEEVAAACRFWKTPVFMKSSLADIWGEALIQEYPFALG
jgi:protein gp37